MGLTLLRILAFQNGVQLKKKGMNYFWNSGCNCVGLLLTVGTRNFRKTDWVGCNRKMFLTGVKTDVWREGHILGNNNWLLGAQYDSD